MHASAWRPLQRRRTAPCRTMDELTLAVRLLLVLAAANTSPLVAKRWFGRRFDAPLDGGLVFLDGRPLLGSSKTVRGLIVGTAAATLVAAALQLPWWIGAQMGAWAMAGDALSSFVKRRLHIAPSGRATGLDQIPEALLPLLAVRSALDLGPLMIAAVTLTFFALELPLARWTHRLGLRDEPY